MIEIKRILCPVDFSDISRRALEHAVVLARWYGSTITVFHAYQVPLPPIVFGGLPVPVKAAPVSEDVRSRVTAALARFIEPFDASGVTVRPEVQICEAVAGILAAAAAPPADLIVMGTHGHSGLDRLVLGSVTEKVLRKAPCPILTIPPASQTPAEAAVQLDRILCPTDFSESSTRALTYALSLAKEADANLLLLHVMEHVPDREGLEFEGFDLAGYARAREEDARNRLQAAIPVGADEWCTPEEIVATGKPYREILRVAREREVRLIVMGVHGRKPIDLMLFGSTTHHVVRGATCPVLTLRG